MLVENLECTRAKDDSTNGLERSGKKAIVVGGAGDLGVAMAEALVEAGTELVIIDLDDKVFGTSVKR